MTATPVTAPTTGQLDVGDARLHHELRGSGPLVVLVGAPMDADAFAPTTTVCWCNGVTVGRIEESAACGNTTVDCVGRDTRAGTGCGGCKGRIAEVLARVAEADGTPSLTA